MSQRRRNAYEKTHTVKVRILRRAGVDISFDDAETLRRAALALHRWHEGECGESTPTGGWAIERDEAGKPVRAYYPNRGTAWREPIADREAGALRRVSDVCDRNGLHFFVQGDPRGCPLYVDARPLSSSDYTRGVAIGD